MTKVPNIVRNIFCPPPNKLYIIPENSLSKVKNSTLVSYVFCVGIKMSWKTAVRAEQCLFLTTSGSRVKICAQKVKQV